MVYAVDYVINVMNGISSTKPVMFQRDGSLFIASQQGFGQVTYGLHVTPQKRYESGEEVPEILESKNLVVKTVKDNLGKNKRVYKKGEEKYLLPILFGPDDNSFTLEDTMKAAAELQKLPDDKKIRMISHESRYHSHKYGYASDGIDVWIDSGRVMDRERYLELIRMNETKLLEAIGSLENLANANIPGRHDSSFEYNRLKFPNCAIITPNVLVSFPRRGRLSGTNSGTSEWSSSRTHFNERVMEYGGFEDAHRESPFNFYVTLNSHAFHAPTAGQMVARGGERIYQAKKEFDVVCASIAEEPNFIQTINAIHNKACAKEIERFRKMHEEFETSKHKKKK